jgi:hypothetical protein
MNRDATAARSKEFRAAALNRDLNAKFDGLPSNLAFKSLPLG